MKLKHIIEILIISLLITSCIEPEKYVIESDFSKLMPDTINGETQKESNKKSQEFLEELLLNTIDRAIPDIEIISIEGEKMNLRNILTRETIIISCDIHCGWGLEGLTNDFPKAMKELEKESLDFNVICLLKRENSDIGQPKFTKTLYELTQFYEFVYIIDNSEAMKINLYPNPTRLYINNDKVVKHIGIGTSLIENKLLNEIKENTGANIITTNEFMKL